MPNNNELLLNALDKNDLGFLQAVPVEKLLDFTENIKGLSLDLRH